MSNQLTIPSVTNAKPFKKKKSQLEITPISHLKWDGVYEPNRIGEPEVELLAEELMNWAKNDEAAVTMYTYVTRKRISRSQWDKLLERWPQLQSAWDFAKGEIGQRREYLGLIGKFNAGLVARTLNVFNPYYKDHFEWEAKLTKQENNDHGGTRYVIIPPIPDVPEVKRLVPPEQCVGGLEVKDDEASR